MTKMNPFFAAPCRIAAFDAPAMRVGAGGRAVRAGAHFSGPHLSNLTNYFLRDGDA